MSNDKQGDHPGEGHYYGQDPQTGWSTTQNVGAGSQGGKLPGQPPKRRNAMTIVVLVLLALVIILGATTVLALRHTSAPPIVTVPTATPQQSSTAVVTPTPTATSPTPTSSPDATAQPQATVANGTITENLLLTCGVNCNDPIRVTITTIQVDGANGHMIWNISMKNVTGSSVSYEVYTFDLLANGTQTQIPATFSQPQGNLTNNDPYNIQGTFAFVPLQKATYTLTAVVIANGGTTITFDPTQINF